MIFVLDNYDSFTYNLVQRLGEIESSLDIQVARNDQITLEEIAALSPERIIISPGPCTPNEAGLSRAVIEEFGPKIPVLGVCLGHQCIAEVYGAKVVRHERLMHGKVSPILHDGRGVFAGIESPCESLRGPNGKVTLARSWASGIASIASTACSFTRKAISRLTREFRCYETSWRFDVTHPAIHRVRAHSPSRKGLGEV